MVDAFAEGVRKVATPFAPKPVIYRCLDFKPDEFLGLPGGEKYEREAGHVGRDRMIGRLHHVAVVVKDADAALGLFRDLMGLRVITDQVVEEQGVRGVLLAFYRQSEMTATEQRRRRRVGDRHLRVLPAGPPASPYVRGDRAPRR